MSKPLEAVFISDLHLHPNEPEITHRFERFLSWVKDKTESLYILGDFLHAWPGDDAMDDWSKAIAMRLSALAQAGVACYFMPGNRDFLLGKGFAELAQWTVLPDPTVIWCGEERVLLSHGDRYCTDDRLHQWFRRLTRHACFIKVFTRLPLFFRQYSVQRARTYSRQGNQQKTRLKMDVTASAVTKALRQYKTQVLIHGHTHAPMSIVYGRNAQQCRRYVLSDWDDAPATLCYYKSKGFEFGLF